MYILGYIVPPHHQYPHGGTNPCVARLLSTSRGDSAVANGVIKDIRCLLPDNGTKREDFDVSNPVAAKDPKSFLACFFQSTHFLISVL